MNLFRDRRFLLLTVGHALNGIGSWAGLIAIWGYAAYHFDLGSTELGLLAGAWGVPPVLLAPLAGVVVDRVGPRRVAVAGDLFNAVVALVLTTADDLRTLLVLATLHGVGKAFTAPAYATLPSRVVPPEQLFAANALFSAAADLALVLGPVVAAGVIAVAGPDVAFWVDAATYVLAAGTTLPLRPRVVAPPTASTSARADVLELLAVVRDRRISPLFALGFSLWLAFGTFLVLEPVFVRDVLQAPVTTFALLQTAFGVGLVVTGFLLPRVAHRLASVSAMSVVMALAGLAALCYAGTNVVPVAFAGSLLWGGCVALFSAPSRTLLMRRTPESAHGRALGAWQAANSLGQVLPAAVVPVVVGVGVQPMLVVASLLPLGTGLAVGARSVSGRDRPRRPLEVPLQGDPLICPVPPPRGRASRRPWRPS